MRLKAVRELRDAGLTVGDVRAFAHLLRTVLGRRGPGSSRRGILRGPLLGRGGGDGGPAAGSPTWTPVSRSCRACGRDSRHAWANRAPR